MNITDDFLNFISGNFESDINKLRLASHNKTYDFDIDLAISQIECRRKNHAKFRDFLTDKRFLFPDSLSAEQASHQSVAKFHASLIDSSYNILDMTAGLGIDTFSFARKAAKVCAIEINPIKAEILKHNAETLGLNNISVKNDDSIEFLKNTEVIYDLIFVDPSRRDGHNNRLYNLKDCNPDILSDIELLFSHSDRILIKASPMLDISQSFLDFDTIASIRTVGIKGECKEVLIELNKSMLEKPTPEILFEAINLDSYGNVVSRLSTFSYSQEFKLLSTQNIEFASESDIQERKYLLEPSAMVMKLQPWSLLCKKYNCKKIGKLSHLFVSSSCPIDFPGKVTIIEKILFKKDLKGLCDLRASVVSRNHPLSADEIRKKYKIKEGDSDYIYATRLKDIPVFIKSKKEGMSKL